MSSAARPLSESQQGVPVLQAARAHRLALAALTIAILAFVSRIWVSTTTGSTAEDFLITLRYARNIAQGLGFVYNPGHRVLGTTTPLYTLLLALFASMRLNAGLCGKLLNIAADSLTCWLIWRTLASRKIGLPWAGLAAALLYAVGSTPINISTGGMESGLVTCVSLGAILAFIEDQPTLMCLLGSLLFLLRIDGLLLLALLVIFWVLRNRCVPWRGVAASLLVALPWVIWATVYFGSPIPLSLVAKLTVYGRGLTLRAMNLKAFEQQFLRGAVQLGLTCCFLVGAARIFQRNRHLTGLPLLAPALLWLAIYYVTMLTSHVPAFAWYFLPPWPVFLIVAGIGGDAVVRFAIAHLGDSTRSRLQGVGPVALAGAALVGAVHVRSVRADVAHTQWVENTLRRPMGIWFREHAARNERIFLEPIGYVGYYSHRPILDQIALVSPEVLASYRTAQPLGDIVRRLRPDWLCLRPAEIRTLGRQGVPLPSSKYLFVRSFRVPGRPPDFYVFHRHPEPAVTSRSYP
ncbi:MAG: hypothetical protein KGJ62_00880 [Armatimonadetes bacterium]|nr:hypothetical protein [Armatimonadota bacterium]MDE2205103.1 hypothetical protein [Armatimonadota bacterium]